MADATTRGYDYPEDYDTIASIAATLQKLAEKIDTQIGIVKSAAVTCATSAGSVVTTTHNWATAFPAGVTPHAQVTLQTGSPQSFSVSLGAVDRTSVEIRVYRPSGTGNVGVHLTARG